jgi:hypothetical protein
MALALSGPALAIELSFGDRVSGSLNLTLGYGASFLASDSAPPNFQGLETFKGLTTAPNNPSSKAMRTYSDKGDLVSNNVRAMAELELNYENFGLLTSASWNYDFQIMDHGTDLAGTPSDTGLGNQWSKGAKDETGNALLLLDAYVFGEFDVAEKPLEVRVGKQVINWGEGLFFGDGISTQVPININKFVLPGSEMKEALVGVPGVRTMLIASEAVSLDAYYFWASEHNIFPGVGTFYGDDIVGPGGVETYVNWDVADPIFGIHNGKLPTRDAKDSGQFGLSGKYATGNHEIGVYFSRYHHFFPMFELVDDPISGVPGAQLREIFPEDQDMFGLSYSSSIGEWSFNAEFAYRPDNVLMSDWTGATATANPSTEQGIYFAKAGITGEKRDTINASAHGIRLMGPGLFGTNANVFIYQLGWDHINGSTDNLAANGGIQSAEARPATDPFSVGLMPNPDTNAFGVAGEWDMTWTDVAPTLDLTLKLFAQYDPYGNSHFWGNFMEDRLKYSTTLVLDYSNAWQASLGYAGISYFSDKYGTAFDRQDTVNFSVDYKF